MAEPSKEARDLATLGQSLREAEAAFQAADADYRSASRKQADALNRLNAQQKRFDEFVSQLRAASPNAGDWKKSARAAQFIGEA